MSITAIPTPSPVWHYKPTPTAAELTALAQVLNTSKPITTLLVQRNITDFTTAKAFFNPCLAMLHPPQLMKGMDRAVARIAQAIQQKHLICIYGDYDVDGVTSTALLYKGFTQAGANLCYYLPDRHQEGYGVSAKGIQHCIDNNVKLLVTIDCGINAVARIHEASTAGIDVIVCDHHRPGDILPPALAILNPKQKNCPYPYKALSGCGIGYKLLQALVAKHFLQEHVLEGLLDLVATSIAADIVPMTGENRVLATFGIRQLEQTPCVGLGELVKCSNLKPPYTITNIVFGLAPPINAAGRMCHAQRALELLLTEDPETARGHVLALLEENQRRKNLDTQLFQEALAAIANDASHPQRCTTVLFNPTWHKGLVGITAARCVEKYYRPTVILTQQGDEATGSARSITGYDIHYAMRQCRDLLTSYGGHEYAAGLTLPVRAVPAFQQRFEEVAQRTITAEQLIPQQLIDLPIRLAEISPAFCGILRRMRPFGPGHRQPVFSTTPVFVTGYQVYQNQHLALQLHEENSMRIWRAIGFNMAHLLPHVSTNQPIAIAYTVQASSYQGTMRYQLFLKDLKPHLPLPKG